MQDLDWEKRHKKFIQDIVDCVKKKEADTYTIACRKCGYHFKAASHEKCPRCGAGVYYFSI